MVIQTTICTVRLSSKHLLEQFLVLVESLGLFDTSLLVAIFPSSYQALKSSLEIKVKILRTQLTTWHTQHFAIQTWGLFNILPLGSFNILSVFFYIHSNKSNKMNHQNFFEGWIKRGATYLFSKIAIKISYYHLHIQFDAPNLFPF